MDNIGIIQGENIHFTSGACAQNLESKLGLRTDEKCKKDTSVKVSSSYERDSGKKSTAKACYMDQICSQNGGQNLKNV